MDKKKTNLELARLAKQAGVSIERMGEILIEMDMGRQLAEAHKPRVGQPPMDWPYVLLMHWVEIERAHNGDNLKAAAVADGWRAYGIPIKDERVDRIYGKYKYPSKPREPLAEEIKRGIMPMTDVELRDEYRAVGMTIERLLGQWAALTERATWFATQVK